MEIFNVGIMEIFFIAILALVLFGPNDLIKNMRKAGRWIHKLVKSPYWRTFLDVQQEIREMPTKIIREAGLEDSLEEARLTAEEFNKRNILDDQHRQSQPRATDPPDRNDVQLSQAAGEDNNHTIAPPKAEPKNKPPDNPGTVT